jgi:hypothetical protein
MDLGITSLQGIPYQNEPNPNMKLFKTSIRYTGMRSNSGIKHLVRNAFFEPSLLTSNNNVEECLKRIEIAFLIRKPAIIGSHRINFMGSLDEKNRTDNLKNFRKLLQEIITRWPDVEFMSSDQLADLMNNP